MTPLFALLPRDVDWGNSLWFIAFVVVPLLARFFKWLLTRVGLLRGEGAAAQQDDPRERLRRAREERRQAESEGEDLWRKLARGEVSEPPPAARAPVPRSEPGVPRATSLEREEELEPLSMLGDVQEPGEAAEVSLEREEQPVPLEALGAPVALAPVLFEATPEAARRKSFQLGRGDLRRAILLSEILGPPVAERPLRA